MKIRFGIVGCGFLGNIIANAWKDGFLEDYELVGVTSRTQESRDKTAAETGCRSCRDLAELLSLEPEYIVEAASVEAVREMACTVLEHGVNLVLLSIGAFADAAFYGQVKDAARRGCAKVHLANGAIGGFDVLQTITLMAQAGKLDETAGIEYTHRRPRFPQHTGLGGTPFNRYRKDDCLYRQRQGGNRNLSAPRQRRRRHLTRHDRTGHHAGDNALRSGLDGRRPLYHRRDRRCQSHRGHLLFHQRDRRLECGISAPQSRLAGLLLLTPEKPARSYSTPPSVRDLILRHWKTGSLFREPISSAILWLPQVPSRPDSLTAKTCIAEMFLPVVPDRLSRY